FETTGAGRSGQLSRMWESDNTFESVMFVYVDRDVTISGGGRTRIFDCDCEEWDGDCECEEWDGHCDCAYRVITQNLNLNLRMGWNALHSRDVWSFGGGMETVTVTVSLGDPARLRWELDE
ncbi:MAG: hypothetical protein FWC65_00610, partial [Treponema sp.]|nr:hypothetical protein [Treponema sp.]